MAQNSKEFNDIHEVLTSIGKISEFTLQLPNIMKNNDTNSSAIL